MTTSDVDMAIYTASLTPSPRQTRLAYAAAVLLRVVRSRGWCPENAAQELRSRLDDDRDLLRLLNARVSRVMLTRPTRTDARAHATLELALAGIPQESAG
ncbi:MAG: hypothetical protein ACTHKG_14835 [Nocardioides sp.]